VIAVLDAGFFLFLLGDEDIRAITGRGGRGKESRKTRALLKTVDTGLGSTIFKEQLARMKADGARLDAAVADALKALSQTG